MRRKNSLFPVIMIFMLSVLLVYRLSGQPDTTGMVRYTPEYRFTDGIFLDFSQVRVNQPIVKARILTTIDYNDPGFYNHILSQKKIAYYDELGVRREVDPDKIWGFARNGNLYYRVGQEFNRIIVVGSICHFMANITTYDPRYYSPYIYDYYYPYSYYRYPYTMESKEARQFLLDFETGKVYEFEVKNVEALLMRDPALYDEYMALSNRKKKQLKFMYIRKFNERNPLYLPANP